MKTDRTLERLRAANPSRSSEIGKETLFDAIVAGAFEPRELAPRRSRQRSVTRLVAVAACALAISVGAAWAAGSDVFSLFAENPAAGRLKGEPATGLWRQVAIESTIRRAGVIAIPRFGNVELWHAETKQHGWCGAIRLPEGGWAGTHGSTGGTAPGCYPSRAQVNVAAGTPVFVITGLDYYDVSIDARGNGGRFWRVVYGVTEGKVPAARIVDTISGGSAQILSGRAFAIALPDDHPEAAAPTMLWHLVAYDADGNVIADTDKPLPTP